MMKVSCMVVAWIQRKAGIREKILKNRDLATKQIEERKVRI